jgi:hypothetical protein
MNDPSGGGAASAGLLCDFLDLGKFHRGGAYDAQAYGSNNVYANYVYGVYMSADGWSPSGTLTGSDLYAHYFGSSPLERPMDPSGTYPHVPADNLAAINAGFQDQQRGSL